MDDVENSARTKGMDNEWDPLVIRVSLDISSFSVGCCVTYFRLHLHDLNQCPPKNGVFLVVCFVFFMIHLGSKLKPFSTGPPEAALLAPQDNRSSVEAQKVPQMSDPKR